MKEHFFPAIRLTIFSIIVFAGLYPLLILGVAKVTPQKGMGERVSANGKTWYGNIGQKFTDDKYFWSRPSAVDYNAAGSAGSNKGPTNPEYLALVKARIDTFLAHNPAVSKKEIPVDLVTASGSGLDPHISVQAARVQVNRISNKRGISAPSLEELISNYTEAPLAGVFGPARVNVLKLNIALDNIK